VSCTSKQGIEDQSKEGKPGKKAVCNQSAEASGPGKGTLHHPAPRQEDKTAFGLFKLDDNEANSRLGGWFSARVSLVDKGDVVLCGLLLR
jgi:hypothetical protein